jgi:hypothetical protein
MAGMKCAWYTFRRQHHEAARFQPYDLQLDEVVEPTPPVHEQDARVFPAAFRAGDQRRDIGIAALVAHPAGLDRMVAGGGDLTPLPEGVVPPPRTAG